MSQIPWLDVIGIGEDGVDGLSKLALEKLQSAEVIVGGDRHHKLTPNVDAKRIAWPSPFDAMIEKIRSFKGKRIVVLVTGDPLWYSVGARILKSIPKEEVQFHPQLSAFQWASARMGWSLADCETLTIHGRANSQIAPHIAPNARLLVLTQNAESPAVVAEILSQRGFGQSRITVLAALGGEREQKFDGLAENWAHDVPDFHTLAGLLGGVTGHGSAPSSPEKMACTTGRSPRFATAVPRFGWPSCSDGTASAAKLATT